LSSPEASWSSDGTVIGGGGRAAQAMGMRAKNATNHKTGKK
jgi:hypothetical protein